ncbi:MAG: ABC transporter substrate-binding protein [Mobilicoccus sp.]|nr:ABC transporter substrate-binding protein [Mobilicoccus sp.]
MNAFNPSTSRRGFLRLAGAMGAAVAVSSAISACAPQDNGGQTPAPGGETGAGEASDSGTITAGISYELGTNGYDPMTTTAALTIAANWHTLEGLTEIDPASRETYAALAADLPQADGTSVDVTLRDGAVFHDGTPVTAEDVVFSFERVMDPENQSLYVNFIPFIESVTASDEQTVTFTLAYPTGVFAERLSVVKIVPKAAVEAGADEFDANPVGTGPYRMTDNGAATRQIVFERFDEYTGPRPARAARMEWQIVPDPATRTNALQSGSVQAIDSVPYLSIDQLENTAQVESVQGFGLLFAMFNHASGNAFADKSNRQAFFHALDMDRIISTGMSGQASPAKSFLQEDHPDFREASTVYTHDVDKARELFGETGLTSMRLLATDHDWVANVTPLIQQDLEAAGVTVQFQQLQSSDVYNTIDGNPGAYDVVIAPGDPSVFGNDPDLLMRWWYAADTWTDQRMHWKGSESYTRMQDLLDQGLRATEDSEREDSWGEAFDLLADELPLYPLFHRKAPTGWSGDTLVDFQPISLTGLSFVGVGSSQ